LSAHTAITVGNPTSHSRRRSWEARTMARAATSGWNTGGTGCARLGMRVRTQSNCGVFSAGMWTSVTWIWLPWCISSVRSASVNPSSACLAAQ
jgi:hypothetical protein